MLRLKTPTENNNNNKITSFPQYQNIFSNKNAHNYKGEKK